MSRYNNTAAKGCYDNLYNTFCLVFSTQKMSSKYFFYSIIFSLKTLKSPLLYSTENVVYENDHIALKSQ